MKFGGRYVPIGLVSLMPYTMKQYSWDDCVKAVQAKYPKAQGITMDGYPCNKNPCKNMKIDMLSYIFCYMALFRTSNILGVSWVDSLQ